MVRRSLFSRRAEELSMYPATVRLLSRAEGAESVGAYFFIERPEGEGVLSTTREAVFAKRDL